MSGSAGIPAAAICDVSEVAADPQLHAREMLHEMQDVDGRRFITVGSPLRMNGAAPPLAEQAPQLGENTAEVLREWLSPEPAAPARDARS